MYKVFYKEYFEELAILGFDNHSELVDFVNDIATDELVGELIDAGCIDDKGLTSLGAWWAKRAGTERTLPNDFILPKDLKKGLNNMPAAIMADLAKQIIITLAHRGSDESRIDQTASQKLFEKLADRFENLSMAEFAAEY